jgi:hypothetical protein
MKWRRKMRRHGYNKRLIQNFWRLIGILQGIGFGIYIYGGLIIRHKRLPYKDEFDDAIESDILYHQLKIVEGNRKIDQLYEQLNQLQEQNKNGVEK